MNEVMRIVKEDNLTVLEQKFGTICNMKIEIRKMLVNRTIGRLEKLEGVRIKIYTTKSI